MSLKNKMKGKNITIGSWLTIGDCSVAEIMARSGFDWLAIDMEHSAITLSEAQRLIRTVELSGITPLVRVSENNATCIKRVMDAGAHGAIVPMVNTREDAVKAVNAVRYPPLGKRGVGLARAQGYGMDFIRYKEWVNKNSVVIVQIEHIDAVENLDDILGTEGIDGFIIGPYDLSASLGKPGDFKHPDVIKAMKAIKKISDKHAVSPGFHVIPPDHAEVLKKISEGFRFVGFSIDSLFLGVNCSREVRKIRLERN